MPNGPGRAGAGLQRRRPPTSSRVPPGPFFPVLAFPFSEFLRTFRQRLSPGAKESGVLSQGGPGLVVGGEAPGKKRKKIAAIAPGSETRREAEC